MSSTGGDTVPQISQNSVHATQRLTLVIAVLTFRRPDELRKHLPQVVKHAESLLAARPDMFEASVLVVDNDPSESARTVVEDLALGVRYVCEPIPGIATARNRALDEAVGSDLLVFIDDDERPLPGWLPALLDTWQMHHAAAVPGTVVPHYESVPDPWLVEGGFFDRPVRASGTRMPTAAAGNLLIDLRQLRGSGLRFEEPFGRTGGEDSLLGRRLVRQGLEIIWCSESAVEDMIPAARLTRSWVLRRAWSQGNLQSLIDVHLAPNPWRRLYVTIYRVAAGCALVGKGMPRAAVGYLSWNRRHQARGAAVSFRGLGMIAGACGLRYEQYARRQAAA